MLSPTSQRSSSYRTLTTSAVLAVTIIILLSLYNLRDARVVASSGSPVRISGEEKEAARVPRYNATGHTSSVSHASGNQQEGAKELKEQAVKFIDSLAHTPGNKQDAARLPKDHAAQLTSSVSHTPGNVQDTAKVPENHAASSLSHTPGNEQDTAILPKSHTAKNTASLSHTFGNEQNTVKVPANNVSSSAIAATSAIDVAIPSTPAAPHEPRRAFVTFLEADTGANHIDQEEGSNPDDEDTYFVGAL